MKPSKLNKDSIYESTQDEGNNGEYSSFKNRVAGEQEMTTGWQFATQIEDDNEENVGDYEVIGDHRESQNKSALLIANRDIFPSMLDPAFEDEDAPSPRAT